MSDINWGQRVAQGRAKDVGMPWNDAENYAIFQLKIPAEYVRRGALTLEDLQAIKDSDAKVEAKTGKKPIEAMDKAELAQEAKEAGVEFTPDATSTALKTEVMKRRKK